MKTKVVNVVLGVLLFVAIGYIWEVRNPQPLIVDGVTDDGRMYFCVYELNQGETHEQVEDQVISNR